MTRKGRPKCPYCGQYRAIKFAVTVRVDGSTAQRWVCKSCDKTFIRTRDRRHRW